MLKELKESMNNQINAIQNYYNVLDGIVTTTDSYFKKKHSFQHPLAAVAWVWDNFDIWITESVIAEDVDCIFTIVIFDNNDPDGKVHSSLDIMDIGKGKFKARKVNIEEDNETLINYFTEIEKYVNTFKGVK